MFFLSIHLIITLNNIRIIKFSIRNLLQGLHGLSQSTILARDFY